MPYSKVRDLPQALQSALAAVGYGRSEIKVEPREKASPGCVSGDGYRAFDVVVDLGTGRFNVRWGSWGGSNPWDGGNPVDNGREAQPIPPNVAVVNGHKGGGRPVYAWITVRPDAIAALLPPASGDLSPRDAWLLWTIATLSSKGRRNEWGRHRRGAPSEAELCGLAERGLVKRSRNGATRITTDGRNALELKVGNTTYHQPDFAPRAAECSHDETAHYRAY